MRSSRLAGGGRTRGDGSCARRDRPHAAASFRSHGAASVRRAGASPPCAWVVLPRARPACADCGRRDCLDGGVSWSEPGRQALRAGSLRAVRFGPAPGRAQAGMGAFGAETTGANEILSRNSCARTPRCALRGNGLCKLHKAVLQASSRLSASERPDRLTPRAGAWCAWCGSPEAAGRDVPTPRAPARGSESHFGLWWPRGTRTRRQLLRSAAARGDRASMPWPRC